MEKKSNKTYWPHMILGFLAVGLTLSYWTVKSAVSLPVQESNEYMMKYQNADLDINAIVQSEQAFDTRYSIALVGVETMVMTDNVNSNRPQLNPVKLHTGKNTFHYHLTTKEGAVVTDANVTFLLTRPHTRQDDVMREQVPYEQGEYRVEAMEITKPGRYTLLLRATVDGVTGFSKTPAYLKP